MKTQVFKFLKSYSTLPFEVDKLIISAYLRINNINVCNNTFIRSYIITQDKNIELQSLNEFILILKKENRSFDIEALIELFEFVVSPEDRIVNGAVYTPKEIREFILKNCIERYNGDVENIIAADISCGCGGFLMTLANKLYTITDKSYAEIFRDNIYGIDITDYSIQRTKILLSLLAVINGEDLPEFEFNLFTGNSLNFNWNDISEQYQLIGGFDIIVGNPPYVCSRNMTADTLQLLKRWDVSRTGHPDLYIPFFQIGFENLNQLGILGYITVNTFLKSINGRALREYFANKGTDLTIISFGGEQLFPERNTYTCICFLAKSEPGIRFIRTKSSELKNIELNTLNHFNYQDLNHFYGWNLANDQDIVEFISAVEKTGLPFEELYYTKNGIATLKNDVYKFKPTRTDEHYYYLNDGVQEYPIEIAICRDIVNANKIKSEEDLINLREKIIFPYDENIKIIPEDIMEMNYPGALAYLETKREILSQRDKGTRAYESWYAYGRKQSMDVKQYKLFFPHICEKPVFTICADRDLLFYNGIAIVSDDLQELRLIKKILESNLFDKYIRNTTKDYASGYISMSRNYLKKFGVYQFTNEEREEFLNLENYNNFLEECYGITL